MNEFPGSRGEDEQMRRLLSDSVSDVEPREGLGEIRDRTVVTPFLRGRPWLLGAGAAALATAATVTAVAVTGNLGGTPDSGGPDFAGSPTVSQSPTGGDDPTKEPAKDPSKEPSDDPTTSAPRTVTVPVYYVGDTSRGVRLFREFRAVETAETDATAALNEALSGSADDPDYRTDWPAGTTATSEYADGVVTVDLAGDDPLRDRPAGMSQEQASLALEQLIYTAQAALQDGRPAVQFLVDGERTDMLLGEPASEPLAEGEPLDVQAMVWVIEPSDGAEVSAPFTVSGLANAFEANVQWELMRGEEVVEDGYTTATECCTFAEYEFTVRNAEPGDYTLVVHDSDPSGGEGFGPTEDTKEITVVP